MTATIFHNGTILTLDDANSMPDAVGIEGERIVAIGRLADIRAALAGGDEVDLAGRTLIPAFIDPHGHFPDSGFVSLLRADLASPPRGDCRGFKPISSTGSAPRSRNDAERRLGDGRGTG